MENTWEADACAAGRRRRCIVASLALVLPAALVPLPPTADLNNQDDRRVQDFSLQFKNVATGLQPDDHLKWEAPSNDSNNVVSYPVEGRHRYEAGWTEWTDLATVNPSADPVVYDITS